MDKSDHENSSTGNMQNNSGNENDHERRGAMNIGREIDGDTRNRWTKSGNSSRAGEWNSNYNYRSNYRDYGYNNSRAISDRYFSNGYNGGNFAQRKNYGDNDRFRNGFQHSYRNGGWINDRYKTIPSPNSANGCYVKHENLNTQRFTQAKIHNTADERGRTPYKSYCSPSQISSGKQSMPAAPQNKLGNDANELLDVDSMTKSLKGVLGISITNGNLPGSAQSHGSPVHSASYANVSTHADSGVMNLSPIGKGDGNSNEKMSATADEEQPTETAIQESREQSFTQDDMRKLGKMISALRDISCQLYEVYENLHINPKPE
ncbi:hypothetical protein DdX_00888 [Ditylenchus destructor]|uniref:Uncharacterized protein n=1 Tax=Ditylenchus destructor TaxID=166010 RepID=A0AAD4RDK9_9BILA|nr:hypothetical protein DdX_00888 [Ditylenchus destructor]